MVNVGQQVRKQRQRRDDHQCGGWDRLGKQIIEHGIAEFSLALDRD